ncbi:MAG: YaaL family protein [Oscillospiraceae bacterium]|mgnify:CR=1 FL=1|nr:YaaL family protein [Oscillospiraceae bacterium]
MEGVISQAVRFFSTARKAEEKSEADRCNQQLIADISDIKMKLDSARCRFDYALDEELVESTIYELESLESRYSYLLKQARMRGLYSGSR